MDPNIGDREAEDSNKIPLVYKRGVIKCTKTESRQDQESGLKTRTRKNQDETEPELNQMEWMDQQAEKQR